MGGADVGTRAGYGAELRREDGVLRGRVLVEGDLVYFEGADETAAREAFRDAADDDLATCAELGRAPGAPTGGTGQATSAASTQSAA